MTTAPALAIGRIVHYVQENGEHVPAMITHPNWHDGGEQALMVFSPMSTPFRVVAPEDATRTRFLCWHWPESEDAAL